MQNVTISNNFIMIFFPLLFLFFLFVGMIQNKLNGNKENDFSRNSINEKVVSQKSKIFKERDWVSAIIVISYLSFFTIVVFLIINISNLGFAQKINNNVDMICNISLGLTSLAFTLLTVTIIIDKKYYLFFSIRDVLNSYKVPFCLFFAIVFLISAVFLGIIIKENQVMNSYSNLLLLSLFETFVLFNLFGTTYHLLFFALFVIIWHDREKKLLNQLYRVFWFPSIDKSDFKAAKKWNKNAVEININFLVERYIENCQKKKINQIEKLEYVTLEKTYIKKWYEKARSRFYIFMSFFFIVLFFYSVFFLKQNCVSIFIPSIVAIIIMILLPLANFKCLQLTIIRLFFDSYGYYVTWGNGRERMIPRVSLQKNNKYDKFIMSMNSLVAFFYIWILYSDDIKKKKNYLLIECELEKMLKRLEELNNKNITIYCPLFTIGFFLYCKGRKIDMVKNKYADLVKNKEIKNNFARMMQSQIINLLFYSSLETEVIIKKVNDYLKFLNA